MNNNLVFVYGTLKKGYGNHSVIKAAGGEFVKTFTTKPIYTMISLGGFPGVIEKGNTAISGEIYRVNNMKPLDNLEGYPKFYNRIRIEAEGSPWMYVLDNSYSEQGYHKITNGKW